MDKNAKYQILKCSLILLILVFPFFLWRAIDRAIFVKEASVWPAPIAWFSLVFITLALAMILIKEKYILRVGLAVTLALSLIYAPSAGHFIVLIICFLLLILAEGKINYDLESRLKINLGKSVGLGTTWIIFAFSLIIASQYYYATKDLVTEKYLPSFEVGKQTSGLTLKLVSNFIPAVKDLDNDQITVDQFIQKISENKSGGLLSGLENQSIIESQIKNLNPVERMLAEKTLKEAEKSVALSEGRSQFSKIAGRELQGGEKMSDVFSEIVNKKINELFMPDLGSRESSSLLSGVIAIVLLLTVMSLGSFLRMLWLPLVNLTFFVLKKSEAISVILAPAEKEMIE